MKIALLTAGLCAHLTAAGWLALAQERHWTAVVGRRGNAVPSRACIATASFAFVVGLVTTTLAVGIEFALLIAVFAPIVGAVVVALALAWRPRSLRPLQRLVAWFG